MSSDAGTLTSGSRTPTYVTADNTPSQYADHVVKKVPITWHRCCRASLSPLVLPQGQT